jgi:hypothetical protein
MIYLKITEFNKQSDIFEFETFKELETFATDFVKPL